MRIKIEVYSDNDDLLQTITTAAEEVSLNIEWERPKRYDFRRPIIRPENRVEKLALVMEKMLPKADGTVYVIKNTPIGQTTVRPL